MRKETLRKRRNSEKEAKNSRERREGVGEG